MARKNDILNIYTKEVEGIKEAGLFKGEAHSYLLREQE